jgi:hypothetical protein
MRAQFADRARLNGNADQQAKKITALLGPADQLVERPQRPDVRIILGSAHELPIEAEVSVCTQES